MFPNTILESTMRVKVDCAKTSRPHVDDAAGEDRDIVGELGEQVSFLELGCVLQELPL